MTHRSAIGRKLAASILLSGLALSASAASAADRVEIYSTFNNGRGARYDLHSSWNIEAKGSYRGDHNLIGVPFIPERDIVLRKVLLGLWHIDGDNAYFVSLRSDAGGVPGEILKRFDTLQGTAPGECCDVAAVASKGIPLSAGQTYWIVLKAKSDSLGGWVFNAWRNEGSLAFNSPGSTGWHIESGVIPAVRILGE